MLFLILMEVFSRMAKRMEGAGLLSGFRADGRRGRGECVSHLLFADDTICFVRHPWSNSYIFICCYFAMRL